ncbi:MAG TPA: DUF6077 domain-containing protein [Elusimicrobiota bacterium]|nr:DUF6077 domain-containing protein [Elusimicrobiota bacterium]
MSSPSAVPRTPSIPDAGNDLPLSLGTVKAAFLVVSTLLACLTILTNVAQTLHFVFKDFLWLAFVACLGSILFLFVHLRSEFRRVTLRDNATLLIVLVTGLMSAALTLVLHRWSPDDYTYLPNVIYHLQNLPSRMGFEIHYVHSGGPPFTSLFYGTSQPYEYAQAVLAYHTRLEPLTVYYLLACPLAGFLMPLALFYAASHFLSSPRLSALGTFIAFLILPFLIDAPKSFAIQSFARAFQGKTFFLAVGIPLFAAASFDFYRKATRASWTFLAVISIALVGATASAAVLLPALALILALAHLRFTEKRRFLKSTALYGLSLSYVWGYLWTIHSFARSDFGPGTWTRSPGFPQTFMEQLVLFFNHAFPLSPLIALASVALSALLLPEGRRSRFLAWVLLPVGLFLNPLTAPFLMDNVYPPSVYYRMFFLFPFPLSIALAAGAVLDRLPTRKNMATVLMAGALLLAHLIFPEHSLLSSTSRWDVGWPKYKVDRPHFTLAKKIAAAAPPGVMLASPAIAGPVTILSARHPQMLHRFEQLKMWLEAREQFQDIQERIDCSWFLDGERGSLEAFKKIVSRYPVLRSIVMRRHPWTLPETQDFCREQGFSDRIDIDDSFVLIWKPS